MQITSPSFANNTMLPSQYSCDGIGVNPPLSFLNIPENAQSLALIVEDPDAPKGTFIHWVLYNIPTTTTDIAEDSVPENAIQGLTSIGKTGYIAACPPTGQHRYIFTLYALDIVLSGAELDKQALDEAMEDHIIESTQLIGLYKRP